MLALIEITPWHWVGFVSCIAVFLAFDLGVFNRRPHVVGFREALAWSCAWLVLAMLFAGALTLFRPKTEAVEFFTGYFLELSLSLDNMLVIALIFTHFAVEPRYQHRVLFWGIIGALVMRGAMIGIGVSLIDRFAWMLYVFGGFLVLTGINMCLTKDAETELEKNPVVKIMRRLLPFSAHYDGGRFFTRVSGRRLATPLFLVLLLVEGGDLLFAVDSIPAIFGVTRVPFIIFTSNAFAILGLRSLYFMLAGALGMFRYLKIGLAVVLVLIGVKMLIDPHAETRHWFQYKIPPLASLLAVVLIMAVAIIASLMAARREKTATS